jgi:hypothetical protein
MATTRREEVGFSYRLMVNDTSGFLFSFNHTPVYIVVGINSTLDTRPSARAAVHQLVFADGS